MVNPSQKERGVLVPGQSSRCGQGKTLPGRRNEAG